MRDSNERSRIARRALRALATAAIALSVAVVATPAEAHQGKGKKPKSRYEQSCDRDRRPDSRYRSDRHDRHDDHRHAYARRPFVVPRVLRAYEVESYAPYYRGRRWDRAHHHHHAVYEFPVIVDGYGTVEPFVYCSGELLTRGRLEVTGPRFGLYLGF